MDEFFRTLTDLIKQYSIADTANVFSIIEGVATVVAAVGAIVAVIVTRKIARSQNKLFEEQNKIAATQIEITKQQNKIALYKERNEVYEYISSFLFSWSTILENTSAEFTNEVAYKIWYNVMSLRVETDSDFGKLTISPNGDKSDVYFSILAKKDIMYFEKAKDLFDLNEHLLKCLVEFQLRSTFFFMYGTGRMQIDTPESKHLIQSAQGFYDYLKLNRDNFLQTLKAQNQLGKY